MDNLGNLTTHEVLDKTGIESSKTLTRWHQRGLIPAPSIQTHPRGRGKISYWPPWIVAWILEVRTRIGRGESLDTIATKVDQGWTKIEMRFRKRPDIAAAFARLNRHQAIDEFSEWAANFVYDFLRKIGVKKPGSVYGRLWDKFSAPEFVNAVIDLIHRGYTPVAAVVGKEIKVIPDFLLATAVRDPKSSNWPIVVVPIRQAFLDAFAEAAPELPKEPRITPVLRVLEHDENKTRERSYKRKGPWDFVLDD